MGVEEKQVSKIIVQVTQGVHCTALAVTQGVHWKGHEDNFKQKLSIP
jgi:hypothetical protein